MSVEARRHITHERVVHRCTGTVREKQSGDRICCIVDKKHPGTLKPLQFVGQAIRGLLHADEIKLQFPKRYGTMAWLLLALSIVFEVIGTTMMKLANGFTELWPSLAVFVCYGLALAGLTVVLKTIDLSVAYAIWSGAGTALIAVIGFVYFKEPVTAMRLISLVLVIVGVVGLQLSANPKSV